MIIASFSIICTVFIDPVLSLNLISLGMAESNTGYAFALIGFSFMVGAPIAGTLAESYDIRYIL